MQAETSILAMRHELGKVHCGIKSFSWDKVKAEYYGPNRSLYESATPPPGLIPLETIRAKYRQAQQILKQLAQHSQNPSNLGPESTQHSQVLSSPSLPSLPTHSGEPVQHQPLLHQSFSASYPNPLNQQHSYSASHSHPSSSQFSSSILSTPPSWYDDEAELGWELHMSGKYVEIGMDGKDFVNCTAIGEVLKSHFGDRRVYDYDTVLTELSKLAYQNHDHAPPGIGPYPHPASGQAQLAHPSSSYGQGQPQH
jgi:hypothetical protein